MTIGDNRDYIRVLLYSYSTTITGWGVLLSHSVLPCIQKRQVLLCRFVSEGRPLWVSLHSSCCRLAPHLRQALRGA